MTDIKHRDNILEAIDQLRRRKARPDIHRICNFMTRRFSVDTKDTKADLQKCVENEIVYKVEYKGNISYRNAARKSYGHIKKDHIRPNSPLQKTENGKIFANIVTTAVAELILNDSDFLDFGVPPGELIKKIMAKHAAKFTKKTLTDLLQREVDNGGLVRMSNGNYSLGPTSDEIEVPEPITSVTTTTNNEDDYLTMNTSEEAGTQTKIKKKPGPKPGKRKNEFEKLRQIDSTTSSVRMGGRRKRAKKVFDPSDNNLPRRNRRGRPLGSLNKTTLERQHALSGSNSRASDHSPNSRPMSRASSVGSKSEVGGVCSVCHQQGRKPGSDKMVSCRECSNIAHYACLNTDDGLLRMYPDTTWQCPHCKTCVICYETSNAGPLTVCSICADAYHSVCHEPKILEKSRGTFKWMCSNCQMEPPLLATDIKPKCEIKEEPADDKMATDKDDLLPSIIYNNHSTSSTSSRSSTIHNSEHSTICNELPNSPASSHSSVNSTAFNIPEDEDRESERSNTPVSPPTLSPQPPILTNGYNKMAHNNNNNRRNNKQISEYITMADLCAFIAGQYVTNLNNDNTAQVKIEEVKEEDPSIPDASDWSTDDVYNYFAQYFPEEEANIFRDQEIDGQSLLLLRRVDVLTNLNLKLGSALKIYRHILKLQVRRDDPRLYLV